MRSTWKGSIRFLLVTIGVKVYKATETAEAIKFNELHKGCGGTTGRTAFCKSCDETLTKDDIEKGYQYEDGKFIVVSDDERESIKLPSDKAIEISGFVSRDEIPQAYFADAYYVGADGRASEKTYALLRDVMKAESKVGIGKIVLRGREELVAVMPQGNALLIQKLNYPAEVRPIEFTPGLVTHVETNDAEMSLAKQLVEQMTSTFDAEVKGQEDRVALKLRQLVDDKIAGRQVTVGAAEKEIAPVSNILDALQASLAKAGKTTATTLAAVPEKAAKKKKKVA